MELNFISVALAGGKDSLVCEVPYSRGGSISISTDGELSSEMLELSSIYIGLQAEGADVDGIEIVLLGRQGLIAWYLQNVGYDPDDDAGEQVEIFKLAKQVAEMAYLHRFGE